MQKTARRILAFALTLVLSLGLTTGMIPAFSNSVIEAEAAALTPVQQHGALSVSGTQLVDKSGQPFQIHGVSTHGLGWDVGYPYNNKAAFQTLRDDWGANCVRLAMYTEEYNGYCNGNKSGMKAQVEKGVAAATELGMYVIIDWHILNDGNPQRHKSEAKEFFREMSSKYKNYSNVIYEICNEPNGCSWSDIKSYALEVIPVIRANDSDAIIIVGTPTWSQLGSAGHTYEPCEDPIRGYSNIMYTFHFYASDPNHNQWLKNKIPTAIDKYKIPVFVTEFGLSEASGNGNVNTQTSSEWLSMCDKYKVSYCAWSLSNKNETSALIKSSCSKTSGWSTSELSTAGNFIRDWYRKQSGVAEQQYKINNPDITNKAPGITVSYRTHVQNDGWQAWKTNGLMAGTSGRSLRLEGIEIKVAGDSGLGIRYRTHVQNIGWQDWKANGVMSGTSGRSLRLEGIQIELTGANKDKYDVYYRVHAQNYGWLDWAKNGAMAGTESYSLRLEGINIVIVSKGKAPGVPTTRPYQGPYAGLINYRTHVQNVGWQAWSCDGAMSGTSGRHLRLEGINIQLGRGVNGGVTYQTHVQNVGWQSWRSNGAMAGTSGRSLRLEGIRISLTGAIASQYDIYYRVHVQDVGWLDWAKNGEMSGTSGMSKRLEGINIIMVPKGGAAPGSTARPNIVR